MDQGDRAAVASWAEIEHIEASATARIAKGLFIVPPRGTFDESFNVAWRGGTYSVRGRINWLVFG